MPEPRSVSCQPRSRGETYALVQAMSKTKIRAVVTDPKSPGSVKLGTRDLRSPRPEEALVRVEHFSLNRGELRLAGSKPPGSPIGWDIAGSIETPARLGGPPQGTRVVAFSRAMEGWAELCPIPLADLSPLPDEVDMAQAATLPVAGGTALSCLDRASRLLGSRVLVTGVTGGVGMFGVKLALVAGAEVTAQVRRPEQAEHATRLGADLVVVTADGAGLESRGPFRLVMDAVGGSLLSAAIQGLEPDGVAVTYGTTAQVDLPLALASLYGKGRAALHGLNLYAESAVNPLTDQLARLSRLMAGGRLSVDIERRAEWSDVGPLAQALIDRDFIGKAVLSVTV